MDGWAQRWHTRFAGHLLKQNNLIHDNRINRPQQLRFCKAWRGWNMRESTRLLVLPLWACCSFVGFFSSAGNLPFQQCQKGFGQRWQGLDTQAHADMSTCSSPSWAYLILPISRRSSWRQLPLHTSALQMKFIYSSHWLLLSLLVFIWIHSTSFHSFLLRSPFSSPAICVSWPIPSPPNCYSAVTNRLHSAGSGWRILQIKLDTETTENAGTKNGPARCSGCLASRNPFSVNTAAAATFGYVTLRSSIRINRSSSRQRA